jgi:hypothetical protein
MFDMQSMCEKVAPYFVKKYESAERGNGCRTKRKTVKSSVGVVYASPKGVVGGSQPEEFKDNDTDAIPVGQPIVSRVTDKKICRGIKSTEGTEEDVVGGSQQEECTYNGSDTIPPLRQPIISPIGKKKITREIKSIKPVQYWRVVKSRGPSTREEIEAEPGRFLYIFVLKKIACTISSTLELPSRPLSFCLLQSMFEVNLFAYLYCRLMETFWSILLFIFRVCVH